jgi:hypothetical protein
MIRTSRLLLLALALVLALPAAASAATVREYQLQFSPTADSAGALAIISAILNPQDPLPATITIPVPAGATVLWAGEILGGEPSGDPSRDVSSERIGNMDVYTMTLEQAYTAQIEIQLPAPTLDGSTVSSSMSWTNPGAEVLVTASVIVEPGAGDVKTTPEVSGQVQTNNVGESLYPLTARRLAEGETYGIEVEWSRGTGSAGGGESSPVMPWVVGALVVAVIGLIAVMVGERTRARRAAASDEE